MKLKTLAAFASAFLFATALTNVVPAMSPVSSAQAQTEYLPKKKDFIGKWKLSGAGIRAPRDLKKAPTGKDEKAANDFQQAIVGFYTAFDYLEIKADGTYNFHQPGDPKGQCVFCGRWSFEADSLWLKMDASPRLDIYDKGGDIRMTYTAEPESSSKFKWQVLGWTKVR